MKLKEVNGMHAVIQQLPHAPICEYMCCDTQMCSAEHARVSVTEITEKSTNLYELYKKQLDNGLMLDSC